MARPAADYKILNSNRSSYNLIAHEQYVPPSPPFGPAARHVRIDPASDYEAPGGGGGGGGGGGRDEDRREHHRAEQWKNVQEKESARQEAEVNIMPVSDYNSLDNLIQHQRHIPDSPLYRPGHGQGRAQGQPGYGRNGYAEGQGDIADGVEASRMYQNAKGYGPSGNTIGQINHVPVSPLYRPGLGRGLNMADPRFGSPVGRRQFGAQETQRPKDPPTPDYNTTRLQLPNNNDDTKLDLQRLRGSQEDLRDKTNNTPWAGYQDRPAPYTDRPGYGGQRSYRENPWTSREKAVNYIADPRFGGHYDGIASTGNRNGGVLLFIRFPVGQGENVQVAAQAFLKSKTHDNGGRFLGLAKKVYDFGFEKGPTEGIGVFHFPSIEKASLFFQMDPLIRQPDFPAPGGHSEVWAINNTYLPDNLELFSTFLLSETELHSGTDIRNFFEAFQKPFESYLYKNGAMPFVISSYAAGDRKSLRRHSYSPSSVVTCHLFQGLDHLNWITNDETYCKFRSLHNQMATEKCSIFTLTRDMFP